MPVPGFLKHLRVTVEPFLGRTGIGTKYGDPKVIRVSDQGGLSSQRQGEASYRTRIIVTDPDVIGFDDKVTVNDGDRNTLYRVVNLVKSNRSIKSTTHDRIHLEEWHF